MGPVIARIKGIAWYKWLLVSLVLIYLIYIALSYTYIPYKLKKITETYASEMIGRNISVEKIEFNPFIISLRITGFSIADKPEKPLLVLNQLFLNVRFWRSLFLREMALDELKVERPEINIIKQKDKFNFSGILNILSGNGSQEHIQQEKFFEKGSIAFEILNTSIMKGIIDYTDISGKVPAQSNLDNISIEIKGLYMATGDEHLNPFKLDASGPDGGHIKLEGEYRIYPLHVNGDLKVTDINLSTFSDFIENIVPVRVSKGKLFLNGNVLAKNDGQLSAKLDHGNASIKNLIVDDDITDPAMLTVNRVSINELNADIFAKNISAESVILDDITSNQWIDKKGVLRYERILPKKKQRGSLKTTIAAIKEKISNIPWNIRVKKVSLKNSTVNFEYRKRDISQKYALSDIDLDLENLTLPPDSKTLIQLTTVLNQKGEIKVDGTMTPSPFSIVFGYHLDNILLKPFSGYLQTLSYLGVDSGELNINGSLSFNGKTSTSINAFATIDLNDLRVKDTRTNASLFSFGSFKLEKLKAEIDKKSISAVSANLLKPKVLIEVSGQKKTNFSDLFKPLEDWAYKLVQFIKSDYRNWTFSVNKINMNDGIAHYSDMNVKPACQTSLYDMMITIDRLSSDMKDPVPFSFRALLDEHAPLIINGELDPLDRQPGFEFDSLLKSLEMPPLSPYSAVLIGKNIKSGKLDLKLEYELHDRKLKSKNHIVAKNLYLGEKVSDEPVIDAPVGLGLALLRDHKGVVSLDVDISGDLDDPEFKISGLMIKILTNIFVKAAASPFKLLGALIPDGDEHMGEISFDPGISILNRDNKDRLNKLVGALNQKPQLLLIIKGNASDKEDSEILKLAYVKQLVADSRGIQLSQLEKELANQDLWMNQKNRNAIQKINDDMGLSRVSERLEKIKSDKPKFQIEELKDIVFKQLFDDILEAQVVSEAVLMFLADQRASSIKQYLVDELKLNHERIYVIKTHSRDLTGRIIKLDVDLE